MCYFFKNAYLFVTAFRCSDSPLLTPLIEVKIVEIIMFLVAAYIFNIFLLLKMLMLAIE